MNDICPRHKALGEVNQIAKGSTDGLPEGWSWSYISPPHVTRQGTWVAVAKRPIPDAPRGFSPEWDSETVLFQEAVGVGITKDAAVDEVKRKIGAQDFMERYIALASMED